MCKLAKAGAKYFEFPMEKPVNGPIEPLPEDDRASADRESVDLALLLEAQLDARDKSPITLRGYQIDFSQFVRWCNRNSVSALPADVLSIVSYLAEASHVGGRDKLPIGGHGIARWRPVELPVGGLGSSDLRLGVFAQKPAQELFQLVPPGQVRAFSH